MMARRRGEVILFLVASLLSNAAADCIAAHPFEPSSISNRNLAAITTERAMIVPYQAFSCEGVVSRWTAVVVGNFNISFLVWKSISENSYTLVGRNDFRVTNKGDSSVQTHSFMPKSHERIKVLPGYVVGLYTIAEVRTGVQAVTLLSASGTDGSSNNITYDFKPPSIDSITNISRESVSMVPNVRPLISAEVVNLESIPVSIPSISSTYQVTPSSTPSLPSFSSIFSPSSSSPSLPTSSLSSSSTLSFTPFYSQTPLSSISQLVTPSSQTSEDMLSTAPHTELPTKTAVPVPDSNIPALLSAAVVLVIAVVITAAITITVYYIIRSKKSRKYLRTKPPLPAIENKIYMCQSQKEEGDYAIPVSQTSGETSTSLNSVSLGSSINKAVVYHRYDLCGPSDYLQPVPLSRPPTSNSQHALTHSAVYEVPVMVSGHVSTAGNSTSSINGSKQAICRVLSTEYETPVDGICATDACDNVCDGNSCVTNIVYDIPPDASDKI